MDDQIKIEVMSDVARTIKNLIDKRIKALTSTVASLKTAALDNPPEAILKMRESKSIENLTVIQELENLKETIDVMYPELNNNVTPGKKKGK